MPDQWDFNNWMQLAQGIGAIQNVQSNAQKMYHDQDVDSALGHIQSNMTPSGQAVSTETPWQTEQLPHQAPAATASALDTTPVEGAGQPGTVPVQQPDRSIMNMAKPTGDDAVSNQAWLEAQTKYYDLQNMDDNQKKAQFDNWRNEMIQKDTEKQKAFKQLLFKRDRGAITPQDIADHYNQYVNDGLKVVDANEKQVVFEDIFTGQQFSQNIKGMDKAIEIIGNYHAKDTTDMSMLLKEKRTAYNKAGLTTGKIELNNELGDSIFIHPQMKRLADGGDKVLMMMDGDGNLQDTTLETWIGQGWMAVTPDSKKKLKDLELVDKKINYYDALTAAAGKKGTTTSAAKQKAQKEQDMQHAIGEIMRQGLPLQQDDMSGKITGVFTPEQAQRVQQIMASRNIEAYLKPITIPGDTFMGVQMSKDQNAYELVKAVSDISGEQGAISAEQSGTDSFKMNPQQLEGAINPNALTPPTIVEEGPHTSEDVQNFNPGFNESLNRYHDPYWQDHLPAESGPTGNSPAIDSSINSYYNYAPSEQNDINQIQATQPSPPGQMIDERYRRHPDYSHLIQSSR